MSVDLVMNKYTHAPETQPSETTGIDAATGRTPSLKLCCRKNLIPEQGKNEKNTQILSPY